MTFRPLLKSGVFIYGKSDSYEVHVGTRWSYATLPASWNNLVSTRAIISLFNGKSTTAEIALSAGVETAIVDGLVRELCRHNLVDLHRTSISYLRRYNSLLGRVEEVSDLDEVSQDFATVTARKRIDSESDATTFSLGDIDGGRSALLRRRSFGIIIFGHGKIVNTLMGALSASGFSKISVINRVGVKDPSLKILETDIGGGFVTRSHIGLVRKKVVDEIRDSSLLFVEPKVQIQVPDLIISVGIPAPDAIQRWMADNTRHLLVETATSSQVRIGPLVIPGRTACFRCIQLSEAHDWSSDKSTEVSAALALAVSGAIALDVIAISDLNTSAYHNTSFMHSTHNYIEPAIQHWSQHHACGCSWLR